MKKINLGQKEVIHFVGIGGIGMSGLAQIMKNMGFTIQGSDQNKNKNTLSCIKNGIRVFFGHSKKNIKNSTILVRSSAVKNNNIELKYAKSKKIPIYSRAEVLADVVSLKKNIIITGSHGKTTTTSLVSKILSDQKLDPTIVNGGVINSFNSNAKLGKGEWAILEADESDGSFLKFPINYSIVTNIDHEHIDYYKNFKNLEKSFKKFLEKTPPTGKSIVCIDNKNIKKIFNKIKNKNILTYGETKSANYCVSNIRYKTDYSIFDLSYKNIKKDVHLTSISGGTDVVGCLVLGNIFSKVYAGEIQGESLGIDVDIFDENGKKVSKNKKGELVIKKPFPTMPIKFWNDPKNKKFKNAYFTKYKNIWHHGDFIQKTKNGGFIIYGRSDATLNPGGVRIGTAEIYRQVEKINFIRESLVVGQEKDGDVKILLFVVMNNKNKLSDSDINFIKKKIKKDCSPKHVPHKVIKIDEIPRTKSGKIVELAVKKAIHGNKIENLQALANPRSINFFKKLYKSNLLNE